MAQRKKNVFQFSGPGMGVLKDIAAADAQEVGDELMRLEKAGTNSPEDIIRAARDPNSPLHDLFDWSDTAAAARWRLHQARTLVCTVRVVIDTRKSDARSKSIRAFVRAPSLTEEEQEQSKGKRRPHYLSTANAFRDPATRMRVLSQARAELRAWRERYRELNELAAVFSAIDEDEHNQHLS